MNPGVGPKALTRRSLQKPEERPFEKDHPSSGAAPDRKIGRRSLFVRLPTGYPDQPRGGSW